VQPGIATIAFGSARVSAFYSTATAFAYVFQPRPSTTPQDLACLACGLVYDEAEGWPDDGIAPGTRWEDIPPAGAVRNAAPARKTSRWSLRHESLESLGDVGFYGCFG
jgi:rubredoxin